MKQIIKILSLLKESLMMAIDKGKKVLKIDLKSKSKNKIIGYSVLFLTTILLSIFLFSNKPGLQEDLNVSIFGPNLPRYIFSASEEINPPLITLGRKLYYDKRLSQNNELSCNSCHQLQNYGVDGNKFSKGIGGTPTQRNAPSVYLAAGQIGQNWDGEYETIETKAKAAILDKNEMGMSSQEQVIGILSSIPEYVTDFQKAFPEESAPLTFDNVGIAMGAFQRGLVTFSPFDAYFAGDKQALNSQQKRGLKLFMDVGCATCHNGTYFGGQMYRKTGLYRPWPNQEDLGRYELTKKDSDRLTFKVSSLRNIAKTAPYYHDGLIIELGDAVRHMAINQLGKELSRDQIRDIVAFLESLTGELPMDYIRQPILPSSNRF